MSNENALEGLSVSFAGEPLDSALLLGLLTTPDSCTYAALKGSPETILARLSDCAADAELTLSVGEEKAPAAGRVDAYLTWLCLMNGPASSARSPVRQQPIRVGGTYVGKALTSYSVDSVVQVPVHTISEWLLDRAKGCPGEELSLAGDGLAVMVAGPAGAPAGVWRHTEASFSTFLDTLPEASQRLWLDALTAATASHAAAVSDSSLLLASLAATLAQPQLQHDINVLWEAPCLTSCLSGPATEAAAAAAEAEPAAAMDAMRVRVLALARQLVPTTTGNASEPGTPPVSTPAAWAELGVDLRCRLPRAERTALLRRLEKLALGGGEAEEEGEPAASVLLLIANLLFLPGAMAPSPAAATPSGFADALSVTGRCLSRLPVATRPMLRDAVAHAWRVALRLPSISSLPQLLRARASTIQTFRRGRSAAAPRSAPASEAPPPRRSLFRGTVHSCDGGVGFVFDFRVVAAASVGEGSESGAAFGVRFATGGPGLDGVKEGDIVEADALQLGTTQAVAIGVRLARRRSQDDPAAGRRSFDSELSLASSFAGLGGSGAAAVAAAPTLPGWVLAEGATNHDGAPLWAGPCSACGALCTVPFRPRCAVGFAVSSPPLCRLCRAQQLAGQAATLGPSSSSSLMGTAGAAPFSPRGGYCGGGGGGGGNVTPPTGGGGFGAPPSRLGSSGFLSGTGGATPSADAAPFHPSPSGLPTGGLASLPRSYGILKFFKTEAGFGFLQPISPLGVPTSAPDIFVHVTQMPQGSSLATGAIVEFTECVVGGRRQAMAVVPACLSPDTEARCLRAANAFSDGNGGGGGGNGGGSGVYLPDSLGGEFGFTSESEGSAEGSATDAGEQPYKPSAPLGNWREGLGAFGAGSAFSNGPYDSWGLGRGLGGGGGGSSDKLGGSLW